ncbi:hypothetical protein NIES4103_70160 (plasmid) [Nostoc sp. NIES-4103]|nr:hypothetical protein NIES4103_70160 [Nostoc sp. NIES-4103]
MTSDSLNLIILCPLDYLLKPKNPTPEKLRFRSPPRSRGGVGEPVRYRALPTAAHLAWWGAMTVGIITN